MWLDLGLLSVQVQVIADETDEERNIETKVGCQASLYTLTERIIEVAMVRKKGAGLTLTWRLLFQICDLVIC